MLIRMMTVTAPPIAAPVSSAAYSTPILDVNLVEAGIGIVEILDSVAEEPANRIGAEVRPGY